MKRRARGVKIKWNPKRNLYEPVILEEHILKQIVTLLWMQARIRVVRINCPVGGKVRPNEAGIPDLIGWVPCKPPLPGQDSGGEKARPLFIECKRPGGVHRVAQTRFIEEAKAAGCIAFFAESWTDVIREMYMEGVLLHA